MARTVTCVNCQKKFVVTDAQYELMKKTEPCCSSECAVEWMDKNP